MHAGTANDENARCVRAYGGAWIADVLKQGTESDRAANARLIAASPCLLEVCREIAALADGQGQLNMTMVAGHARAAIAKATGTESGSLVGGGA